jgi:asparagine synthase (glutamine-hydrolysing)
MCGIAGIADRAGRVDPDELTVMTDRLAHRGPDDGGVWLRQPGSGVAVGLGHRRLSVIDLSANGKQPMPNEDGTVWITFNGEIYNFQDLRSELLGRGHVFRSETDTEVVVHLYEEMGERCVERLNGMFAFAIWDERRERLLLARDRLGVKPLVYAIGSSEIRFASEIGALAGMRHDEIDLQALNEYFTFRFVPTPRTIYRDIRKLPPGSILTWRDGRVTIDRYWSLTAARRGPRERDVVPELRETVEDAVRIRLTSDVPLGGFLSGGLDSSAVVALMSRIVDRPVKTFHVSFEGAGRAGVADERAYARGVARRVSSIHEEIVVTQHDALAAIPRILDSFDEPFGSDSAIPTYLLSEATRDHVTVALSGDGPDELFGGYRIHRAEQAYRYYRHAPSIVRERVLPGIVGVLPASGESRAGIWVRRARRFVEGGAGSPSDRYFRWLRLWPDATRSRMLGGGRLAPLTSDASAELVRRTMADWTSDPINQMLIFDTLVRLPDHVLTKVDLMSMQHGLEVRSPFLDYRVAELAFSLPGNAKISGRGGKRILSAAIGDLVPRRVLERPKQGFDLPVGQWLRRDLNPLFRDVVTDARLRDMGILDPRAVRRVYDEHCEGRRDHSWTLWVTLVLCWWWYSDRRRGTTPLAAAAVAP